MTWCRSGYVKRSSIWLPMSAGQENTSPRGITGRALSKARICIIDPETSRLPIRVEDPGFAGIGPYTQDITVCGRAGTSNALAPGSSDPTGLRDPGSRKEPGLAGQVNGASADPVPGPGRTFDRVARTTPIATRVG